MLKDKILKIKPGIIAYGITPPKQENALEKNMEISQKQIERIKSMEIDALLVYDLQDESARNNVERPYPFFKTVDSIAYSREFLKELEIPKIIYRCVEKYTEEEMLKWITSDSENDKYSVFVGASSDIPNDKLKLSKAYELNNAI